MNKINFLLDHIHAEISPEVLDYAFEKPYLMNRVQVNVDSVIKDVVIQKRLLPDINMTGGIETIIDISNTPIDYVQGGMIYNIGLGPTGGRNISSVLSVSYGFDCLSAGSASIASAVYTPLVVSDSRIELVAPNVVYVEGYIGITLTKMRVTLDHDETLSNINNRSMLALAELCNLATKAHIYKSCTMKLRNAVVVYGQDMSKLESIIEEYKDCYSMYKDMLTTRWFKIQLLSDAVGKQRDIRRRIPG